MTKRRWLLAGGGALLLVACGTGVAQVYRSASSIQGDPQKQAFVQAAEKGFAQGDDSLPVDKFTGKQGKIDIDDPTLRDIATRAELGDRTPQFYSDLLAIGQAEAARWDPKNLNPNLPSPGTRQWTNLGPGSARTEYNGTYYTAMDTGRPTAIASAPNLGTAGVVFLATSGGGVWATSNFGSNPNWSPVSDNLGTLAIGAMDVFTSGANSIVIGTGDAFDQGGGAVITGTASVDASGVVHVVWHTPVVLSAATRDVRDVKVDPNNQNIILAAASDGLYRSTNAGVSFTKAVLPATGGAASTTWNIAYTGKLGVSSNWVVSGVNACAAGLAPPSPGGGKACNTGDLWTSNNSGATWTSVRTGGGLPIVSAIVPLPDGGTTTQNQTIDVGRMAIGAGAPGALPNQTVLYAEAGNTNEGAGFTSIMKSTNGGTTWTALASPGTTIIDPLTNPTTSSECTDTNLGHGQSYYNLTVAVDPTNSNHAIFGGNLCGARTTNGGTSFDNTAHWLPSGGIGFTNNGVLPYVHADWHAALITTINGVLLTLVGSDGGLFVSDDVFSAPLGELTTWTFPDIGIITHLFYSLGSGDPVFGAPDIVFGGLQDNGFRFRLLADENFIQSVNAKNWDQVGGGDGIGAAVTHDPLGLSQTYWGSSEFNYSFCKPLRHDCSRATRIDNGIEINNWVATGPAAGFPAGDAPPFFVRYSPVNDAAATVLTASTFNAYKVTADANEQSNWTLMTPNGIVANGAARQVRGNGVTASPFTYMIGGKPTRIYGVPLTGGNSALITDDGTTFTLLTAAHIITVGGVSVTSTSSVAQPSDPTHLTGGTDITQTYLLSSVAPSTTTGLPVPAAVGHLFLTVDGGNTWTAFHGNGTSDLPNVPVYVVKFDPSDSTDQTIYAGTELGLYRTTDGGNTWARYGLGLPLVRVTDLVISDNGSMVRAATYGRGVWEVRPHGEPATASSLGDWNNDKVVDFFDMAPLANRMGTPGPQLSPSLDYDNTLDLNGDGTINEADLSAQLAKFGSTP